jgi:hypothetical protein
LAPDETAEREAAVVFADPPSGFQREGASPSWGALPKTDAASAFAAALATGCGVREAARLLRGQVPDLELADAMLALALGPPPPEPADPLLAIGAMDALADMALTGGLALVIEAAPAHGFHPLCVALSAVTVGAGAPAAEALRPLLAALSATGKPLGPPYDGLTFGGHYHPVGDAAVAFDVSMRVFPRDLYLRHLQAAPALPNGLIVGGDLDCGGSAWLETLPRGLTVLGDLNLRDCPNWDGQLPDDARVGGAILLGATDVNEWTLYLDEFRQNYPYGWNP